jgi:hypothetical protein
MGHGSAFNHSKIPKIKSSFKAQTRQQQNNLNNSMAASMDNQNKF